MTSVYINADPDTRIVDKISPKACGILWGLYNNMDIKNICSKEKIQNYLYWIKDKRSWKKYWQELLEKELIIYLDQDTFMVSPHQCYREGASQKSLIDKWTELKGDNT